MQLQFSIVWTGDAYVGSVKEYPGVLTQGKTVAETKANLLDALQVYLEAERENGFTADDTNR